MSETLYGETPNRLHCRAKTGLLLAVLASFGVLFAGTSRTDAAVTQSPAPERSAAEKAYAAKIDSALAPLIDLSPSSADLDALRDVAAAVRTNNLKRLEDAKSHISDPVARKLADWIRLRTG